VSIPFSLHFELRFEIRRIAFRHLAGYGFSRHSKPSLPPPQAIHAAALFMNEEAHEKIDPEVMRRVAAGDLSAFSELYDGLATPLFSFAVRMLRDPEEAEDLLQDVFVKIWNQAGSYDPQRGTPFAWAATLTRYKALDRMRARQRRERLHDAAESNALDAGENARESGDTRADAEALRNVFDRLPCEQREAIDLAYFGGLTQPEIAAKLRQPLGTVKARIRRGMLKLRDYLARKV
jgi:RNA polymerase sigma-70 factor (ECF subfamily)